MIDKSSIISLRRKLEKEAWEIKPLGEIATEIVLGNRITQEQTESGNYPTICRPELLRNKENIHIRKCVNQVNIESIKNPRYCQFGDLLLIQSCRRIENLGHAVVYLGNERPILGDHIFKVTHNENPSLMPHLMACEFIRKQIRNFVEDTVIVDLRPKHIQQIKIPLLPRNIQTKVADFLDQFSNLNWQLEEELRKELEKRKQQYEYYKETILNGGIDKWGKTSLDKIAIKITTGNEVKKDQLGTGDYPAIRYADIFKGSLYIEKCTSLIDPDIIKSPKHCEYGDLLISKVSENLQDAGKSIVYLGNEKPIIGQAIHAIKHKENPKFLSYILESKFVKDQFKATSNGVIIINITKSCFEHIKVPLPSLEEQNRIVEVLDKLRTNIENLQNEIPLLIEDLKKQYIYYREQMLNPEIVN